MEDYLKSVSSWHCKIETMHSSLTVWELSLIQAEAALLIRSIRFAWC